MQTLLTINSPNKTKKESRIGLIAVGCAVLSILGPGLVFVPISFMISIASILHGQLLWGFVGLFLSGVGLLTSPMLLGIIGLGWLWLNIDWIEFLTPNLYFYGKGKDI